MSASKPVVPSGDLSRARGSGEVSAERKRKAGDDGIPDGHGPVAKKASPGAPLDKDGHHSSKTTSDEPTLNEVLNAIPLAWFDGLADRIMAELTDLKTRLGTKKAPQWHREFAVTFFAALAASDEDTDIIPDDNPALVALRSLYKKGFIAALEERIDHELEMAGDDTTLRDFWEQDQHDGLFVPLQEQEAVIEHDTARMSDECLTTFSDPYFPHSSLMEAAREFAGTAQG